jgi:hypothetical protein
MATNYVDNKRFYKLLIEYQKTHKRVTYNEIGKIFVLISSNLLNKTNFINYTQDRKDEMISDATFSMCRYIDKYDTSKGNPFAYFTRFAFNAFLQNLKNYKRIGDTFTNVSFIDNFERYEELK